MSSIRTMERKLSAMVFLAAALALVAPAGAFAQTISRPYFSFGIALERRDFGNREMKLTTVGLNSVSSIVKPIKPGPTAAVGVFIKERIGLEAQVQRSALVSWPYTYSYPSNITKHTAEHRDTFLLGNVRVRAGCWSAVCLEPTAGAGVAIHQSSSVTTATCGSIGVPLPCTTVIKPDWDAKEPKLAVAFGADVRFSTSARVAIVPSFRVHFIRHKQALHGTDHRLPRSGDRWFLAFGASISVR